MPIERTYNKFLEMLSIPAPRAAARADFVRPNSLFPWGGPMNGQKGRQCLVRALQRHFEFVAIVETGAYRGTTTEFLHYVSGAPVFTVEMVPRFFHYARRRLAGLSDISVELGDSREFLRSLAVNPAFPVGPILCYLDAHWDTDLPLAEELLIIADHWPNAVVMIDDFEVPDDAGYGFDNYGPGAVVGRELIPAHLLEDVWTVTFPALAATAETGARRGCAVLLPRQVGADTYASLGLRTIGLSRP